MADAHALGACVLTDVGVRIPPSPPVQLSCFEEFMRSSETRIDSSFDSFTCGYEYGRISIRSSYYLSSTDQVNFKDC